MHTITPDSKPSAIFNAACKAPPLLIPANTPSSLAILRVMATASASLTSRIWSTLLESKILGKNSGDHLRIPGILEPSVGCVPTIWTSGFCSFRYLDTPMMVPVVPIAETK